MPPKPPMSPVLPMPKNVYTTDHPHAANANSVYRRRADAAQVTEAIYAADANTIYMPPMPPKPPMLMPPMPPTATYATDYVLALPPIHRPCLLPMLPTASHSS